MSAERRWNVASDRSVQAEKFPAAHGLRLDPFPTDEPDDFYFATPLLTQQLDMLQNLVQYNNALLAITGVEGAGKSTLLRELLRTAGPRWRVCAVVGSASLSVDALLGKVLEGFGLRVRGRDRVAHVELLGSHLAGLHASNQIALVAVDDAHLLGEQTRDFLMDLAGPGAKPRARFVVTCEPGSPAIADARTPRALSIHTVELQALDLDQTEHYLHARLDHAGLVGDNPFDPRTVRTIHRVSGGIPGAIHRSARDVFEGHPGGVSASSTRRVSGGSGAGRALRLMVAVVVLSATVTLVVQRMPQLVPGLNEDTATPLARAPSELIPAERPTVPAPRIVDESPAALPAQVVATAVPTPEVGVRPGGLIMAPGDVQYDVRVYPLAPTADTGGTRHSTVGPAAVKTTEPRASLQETRPVRAGEPRAADNSGSMAVVIPPGVRDERWLQAQNPHHYVIQLVGSREPGAVGRFLVHHALGEEAAWFATSHDGQPWYVVVYGLYPDRTAAHSAITSLPKGLRDGKPWARPIAGIIEGTR
jgi:DamX protein